MRRPLSVCLLVLGGWILMSEVLVAWLDLGEGWRAQLFGLMFFLAFAAVPLALGTWASPGNRLADLGLTMMIGAGLGTFAGLAMVLTLTDPQVAKMLPPDQSMPVFAIYPEFGAINLLLVAGGGYALWRRGRGRAKAKATELKRVFGDG